MIEGEEIGKQGLGSRYSQFSPWESHMNSSLTRECLWIINSQNARTHAIGIIQFTIHNDINVDCQKNSVYVYDGLPDFVSSTKGYQSEMLGVYCSDSANYPVTVEANSGYLTVHYKQLDDNEGFNASYVVLTCNNCPGNRECRAGSCVCRPGFVGIDCDIEICPNNCSAGVRKNVCDKEYGHCVCVPGYGGKDCSVKINKVNFKTKKKRN